MSFSRCLAASACLLLAASTDAADLSTDPRGILTPSASALCVVSALNWTTAIDGVGAR